MEEEKVNITFKDIILRDRGLEDILDYIDWNTNDTEWQKWDAPWEFEEKPMDEEIIKLNLISQLEKPLPNIRRRFEIYYKDGTHIGWVNSYYVDGDKNKLAIGIDIAKEEYRGKKLGEYAFIAFIFHFLNSNFAEDIYTQTWSGNERMIRLAVKCGFEECNRISNFREVRGKLYDALTFKLNKEKFKMHLGLSKD